jgi:hypothetical protein
MRILIATITLLALVAGPAMAQTGSNTGSSPGATNPSPPAREAPVGHRQPRAGDVPSEKNLSSPNDAISREDAALDKKIKSICRGC